MKPIMWRAHMEFPHMCTYGRSLEFILCHARLGTTVVTGIVLEMT